MQRHTAARNPQPYSVPPHAFVTGPTAPTFVSLLLSRAACGASPERKGVPAKKMMVDERRERRDSLRWRLAQTGADWRFSLVRKRNVEMRRTGGHGSWVALAKIMNLCRAERVKAQGPRLVAASRGTGPTESTERGKLDCLAASRVIYCTDSTEYSVSNSE
jgi:hypothetical protein